MLQNRLVKHLLMLEKLTQKLFDRATLEHCDGCEQKLEASITLLNSMSNKCHEVSVLLDMCEDNKLTRKQKYLINSGEFNLNILGVTL